MNRRRAGGRANALQIEAEAEDFSAQLRRNIQRASNYVLGVGCAVFLCTAVWIATSPVSITV